MEDKILEKYNELWQEMWKELLVLTKKGIFNPSTIISKIRDYNRKWNTCVEDFDGPIDGFKDIVKYKLIELDVLPEEIQTAVLKYL